VIFRFFGESYSNIFTLSFLFFQWQINFTAGITSR